MLLLTQRYTAGTTATTQQDKKMRKLESPPHSCLVVSASQTGFRLHLFIQSHIECESFMGNVVTDDVWRIKMCFVRSLWPLMTKISSVHSWVLRNIVFTSVGHMYSTVHAAAGAEDKVSVESQHHTPFGSYHCKKLYSFYLTQIS